MATNEALFSVSMKTRNGTILTLRADDFETFSTHIADAVGGNINLIIGALEDVVHGQDPVAYATQALGATSVVTTPNIGSGPVAPPSMGSFPAPTCHHGPKKHKSGQGAKGPWQAWMCPLPKERKAEQCQPQWIRKGQAGWVN
jgi:hypothetical protein